MYDTVESEFDKNYEKYGFIFEFSEKQKQYLWKNDQWDVETATRLTKKFMDEIYPYRKSHPWLVPGLLWAGYDRETLKHEKLVNFYDERMPALAKRVYDEYYNKLLAI